MIVEACSVLPEFLPEPGPVFQLTSGCRVAAWACSLRQAKRRLTVTDLSPAVQVALQEALDALDAHPQNCEGDIDFGQRRTTQLLPAGARVIALIDVRGQLQLAVDQIDMPEPRCTGPVELTFTVPLPEPDLPLVLAGLRSGDQTPLQWARRHHFGGSSELIARASTIILDAGESGRCFLKQRVGVDGQFDTGVFAGLRS